MKIVKLESFLTNAGLRNYLFLRLTTDTGLTGIGEASLEWQEKTVQTLVHEWVEDRILGTNPFDIEAVIGGLIRDQYQGGATIMTAISGVEIALWDIVGKACTQPVYRLLGGRCHERLPAYANGWYGGARTAQEYAEKAREVVARGYKAMKFDPFGTAWKEMTRSEQADAEGLVATVRQAVGDDIDLMIEVHGRLSAGCAIAMGQRLARYRPAWYEEPVAPQSIDLLKEVKAALPFPVAAGERLYTLEEFERLLTSRAVDVVQMDPAHCGGLHVSKKIAGLAQGQDISVSPHCSIGPVALCAALHFDWATPNVIVQENFAEYDVPWRNDLVFGWNPIKRGEFLLPEKPGLGLELNVEACAAHPYRKNSFPSLWDKRWLHEFTQNK
ncbi:MAG TPA: mandelate racemase/muconate lactonizing enzyme family protein [Gemmataceae bacterium]|jgi:galactonate dehydratase|nr:mandelate racemase/muconate lactonizing enzyme family protein [Gemmataceae bacterium]